MAAGPKILHPGALSASSCVLPRVAQPAAHLIVDVSHVANLEMVHEAPGSRFDDLLDASRARSSRQRERQDEGRKVGAAQPAIRHPHPRKAAPPLEDDLALRHANRRGSGIAHRGPHRGEEAARVTPSSKERSELVSAGHTSAIAPWARGCHAHTLRCPPSPQSAFVRPSACGRPEAPPPPDRSRQFDVRTSESGFLLGARRSRVGERGHRPPRSPGVSAPEPP